VSSIDGLKGGPLFSVRLAIKRELRPGEYEHFLYLHVRLLLALTAVPVSEIGQAEEEQSKAIYEAASLGVKAAIEGLSDGGVLRSASNLGVIMIV
jgi:hypothetical protein